MEIQKQQSYGLHINTLKYANQVGNLSSLKHTFRMYFRVQQLLELITSASVVTEPF